MAVDTLSFLAWSDEEVQHALKKYAIGLTVDEARTVEQLLGRPPTVVEAIIWGIQGSEHCSYKSSRRFLSAFHTEGKHVILGPKEDSGIIAITDGPPGKRWGIVISHESHNHPSQIVPYEGAATGVGGIVRDVSCMGGRVIGLLDALRLGDLSTEESKTIATEVVRGIAGYGNPLGIPNLGGDVQFDTAYNNNCLVNVVCHGLVREDEVIHSYAPVEAGEVGYDIILVGKATDRSGFGGAAFSSGTLEEDEKDKNTGAVQEPNPFLERHLLASMYALFDWLAANNHLGSVGLKDLGAGGVVCSSVEQVAEQGMGAEIDLDAVHVALPDLPPEVIACAETQERFCWTCHPDLTQHILTHFNDTWDLPGVAENARASVIGKVTTDDTFRLRYKGDVVCEARACDITEGLLYERPVHVKQREEKQPRRNASQETDAHIRSVFEQMLTNPNHACKASIFRHYDKNVIGNTLIESGEGDAGVIAPLQDLDSYVHEGMHPGWDELPEEDRFRGVAVACDGNGRYGTHSAYWQGANATVESMRNVAAVGGLPRALTDCLNYANPEDPAELWELQQGIQGIADAARGVDIDGEPVPIISGNVSLYNTTPEGSIPPTAIVSCVGVLPDARKAVSSSIQHADAMLWLIGERSDECGGSAYYSLIDEEGGTVPQPDFEVTKQQILFVHAAINRGYVSACHDISEGGLMLALFEMCTPSRGHAANRGLSVNIDSVLNELPRDIALFSETGGFVMEVPSSQKDAFNTLLQEQNMQAYALGTTTSDARFEIEGVCSYEIGELLRYWNGER